MNRRHCIYALPIYARTLLRIETIIPRPISWLQQLSYVCWPYLAFQFRKQNWVAYYCPAVYPRGDFPRIRPFPPTTLELPAVLSGIAPRVLGFLVLCRAGVLSRLIV